MRKVELKDFLTADEVAFRLGVTRRTLLRWARLRHGPPVTRVGRHTLYRCATLAEWLDASEQSFARQQGRVSRQGAPIRG